MTVATLNPFSLLDGDAPRVPVKAETKSVAKTDSASKPTATTAKTTTPSTKPAKTTTPSTKPTNTKNVDRELNTDAMPPTDRPKENHRRHHGPRRPAPTNERQARRQTDRHSRTGYKQDGEKKMTAGKASWGREGEVVAEEVVVDVSASNEDVASTTEEVEATAETMKHLTLAQYQAQLKKPSAIAAPKLRTVAPLKTTEVLNKKPLTTTEEKPVKKSSTAAAAANGKVDLSKYIAVKAVGETTEAEPRRSFNDRKSHPASTTNNNTTTPVKVNLKDERAFPALGKK